MPNTLVHSSKPLMRLEYETAVKRLGDNVDKMRQAGKSEEEIAKWANAERWEIGKKFKDQTDPELREVIYRRNINTYGDPLGPTYEDFKRGYAINQITWKKIPVKQKTDTEIIQGAVNAGGNDFPWDLVLEFSREKKTGDPQKAAELLKKIDGIVNRKK